MNYKYIIKFIKNINDKKGKYRLIWKTVPWNKNFKTISLKCFGFHLNQYKNHKRD